MSTSSRLFLVYRLLAINAGKSGMRDGLPLTHKVLKTK